ncbi:MAG: hypothetical protein OXC01_11730 [Immundisolibacterales bacterium]|nr:hypothetical protein [Immundisolibacterales bacterium]
MIKVAGLPITTDRTGTVADADYFAWARTPEGISVLAGGGVEVRPDPAPPMGPREHIRRYMLSGVDLPMTLDGRPRVDALEKGMGYKVSDRDRDFAWSHVRAVYRPLARKSREEEAVWPRNRL